MYICKSFKQKNGWSKFYRQEDPLTVSQIVFADNQEDAIQIASDKARDDFIYVDSYYMGLIDSIESASALFIDGDGASEPSGMFMHESSHLIYNDINECKDNDKKTGMCVFDNIIGVYSPYIKKFTREKLIELCRHFFNKPQRDENNIPIIEIQDDSDNEDELIWKPQKGITPACLQYICETYNITHYTFDITNQCFLKYVAKKNTIILH